ncbi:MAG: hypothetical protein M3Y48_15515 [Actinomycetota bacterium]|nr:hypothetical protein [Actinomycetota bacterium]
MITAFGEPVALERTVRHPMGELPASQLLGMRVTEWTIHAWDLARALDADETLDADLIELIYARLAPRIEVLAGTGYFQPADWASDHRASPEQAARPTRPTAVTTPGQHPTFAIAMQL